MNIKLFESDFDEATALEVADVIRSGWLTNGQQTIKFEEEIGNILGLKQNNIISVSSATAALHLILISIGIKPGDEVISPALTFVSDFNVVNACNGVIKFCDVESVREWSPSVQNIEENLTKKTKAVMVTHFAGIPAKNILEIKELCQSRNIILIEDCAHALGASIDEEYCGTIGDFGAFSFYSNKNISTGEGGVISTRREDFSNTLRMIRSHGMTTSTLDREKGRAFSYDVIKYGLNYRFDEIRATLGLNQLRQFKSKHDIRDLLVDEYVNNFKGTDIYTIFNEDLNLTKRHSVNHIMPILLPNDVDKQKIIAALQKKNIQSSMHYPPPWGMTAYKNECKKEQLPVTEEITRRELTLPLHTNMKIDDVKIICETLFSAL